MCEILNDVLFCFIPLSPGPSLTLSGSEALRPRLSQAWEVSEKNMRRKAAKFFPLSYVLSVIQKREECSSTHTHTPYHDVTEFSEPRRKRTAEGKEEISVTNDKPYVPCLTFSSPLLIFL